MATRRDVLAGLAAAGLLAAWGGGRSAAAATATRTVTSDNGPVEVPVTPQRVVAAIGSFETDMVAVGVMPVLTSTFAGPWVTLDPSVVITENIPPTPEELLAARPDLVIGWNWVTQEPVFDELVRIAPYVGLGETEATAGPGFDGSQPLRSWDTLFLSVCDALGKRAQGQRLVTELEARLDDLAARRRGEPATSVARIEFYEPGSFSFRGQNEDTAELMRRIGLDVAGPDASTASRPSSPAPAGGPDDSGNDESLERLPDIDADWLLIPTGTDNIPRSLYEEIAATPLFKAIPAVRAGRVHLVDAALWPGLGHL
ncbi:MAG: ABC transporter substrate-binding protein [Egibacteraceae bacterium]